LQRLHQPVHPPVEDGSGLSGCSTGSDPSSPGGGARDAQYQAKELLLLRRTVEEMELRIESQKQTLGARDESIKRLLDMLQSKGLNARCHLDEERFEADHLRAKNIENEQRLRKLESMLETKDRDMCKLKEVSACMRPPLWR
jgi:hypothetical protein